MTTSLTQCDLKDLPIQSCSQQVSLNSCPLLLKINGTANPVTVRSPFQVSSRDVKGNPITRLVVFLGDSKDELQAFYLDENEAFQKVTGVNLKKVDKSLINCSSAEEFNKLKNVKNTKIITLRNACVIPKSLIRRLVSENAKSVDEMIQVTAESCFTREIDEDGNEVVEFTESDENLGVVYYLSAFASKIQDCLLTPVLPGSPEMKEVTRRKKIMFPEEGQEFDGSKAIANELKENSETLKENSEMLLAQISATSRAGETKPKERLSKSTLTFVKHCLTIDGENPVDEFGEEAKDILLGSSESERIHALETHIKRRGIYDCSLSLPQCKDVCDGKFSWKSNESPGGISLALIQRDSSEDRTSNVEMLRVINLKSKDTKYDSDSIDKLTKTCVVLPMNTLELIGNVQCLCSILHTLQEDCLLARQLDNLVQDLRANQRIIQSYCNTNEEGITMILCAIDRRIKNYFEEIAIYPDNLEHICKKLRFDDIITSLENGMFNFTAIPSFIKKVDQSLDKGNKKRKTNLMVENEFKDPDLILDDPTDYVTYFKDKPGAPADECLRFQLKGYCFSDYRKRHLHREVTVQVS